MLCECEDLWEDNGVCMRCNHEADEHVDGQCQVDLTFYKDEE